MMNFFQRCFIFSIYFGHLIAGVDHGFNFQNSVKQTHGSLTDSKTLKSFQTSEAFDEKLMHANIEKLMHSTLTDTLCPPYDSCSDRCGKQNEGFTHTCNCDPLCHFFGDCCLDYQRLCDTNGSNDLHHSSYPVKPKCELLVETFPVYLVSDCPDNWKDSKTKELCNTTLPAKCVLSKVFFENGDCETKYYTQCVGRLSKMCSLSIDPQCPTLVAEECKKRTSSVCEYCNKSFWPVVGSDGILYKNSHCATCNLQQNYTITNLFKLLREIGSGKNSEIYPLRKCFQSMIDTCETESALSAICSEFSCPVMSYISQSERKIYKNIYCAACHNESSPVDCASPYIIDALSSGSTYTNLKPRLKNIKIQGHDIPTTFSMLLNFGLDGRQIVKVVSEDYQNRCPKGKIWDPFSSFCRKLHCSTEFVLVNYECVRRENATSDSISDLVPNSVHLTLTTEFDLFDFLHFYGKDGKETEVIRESFARSWNISLSRIKNVRFNISLENSDWNKGADEFLREVVDESRPINFIIDLDLIDIVNDTDSEPSIENVVSTLESAVSLNGFEFDMKNFTGRINRMHQSGTSLKSWCRTVDGDEQVRYTNSDFRLILSDNTSLSSEERVKGLYVNKTGRFYHKGQFIADILYQSFQSSSNLVNVSGLAVVCDRKSKLNESCPRIVLEKDEYEILENGSLIVKNKNDSFIIDYPTYDSGDNESILMCSEPLKYLGEIYNIKMNVVQAYVSYVLSWISITAMIIVLLTYSFFSSLRNLPGCNTMNLTFSLLAMKVTYVFGEKNSVTGTPCKVTAILLHYEILCCFMWMNIMAFDLFKTFGAKTVLNNIRSKGKYLPRYMLFSYGIPLLMILVTFLLDYFLTDSQFSPHYGDHDVCWITSKQAAILYFAVPLAIIMCINLFFYILTILSIHNVKHILYLNQEKTKQAGRNDVCLYARMAFVIGLTWALAFAAAYVKEDTIAGKILTYLFIIFNTLQGVFIFFVFVCNKRVFRLYRVLLRKAILLISNNPTANKTSTMISRIANSINRSISADTIISTVSNSSTGSRDSKQESLKAIKSIN